VAFSSIAKRKYNIDIAIESNISAKILRHHPESPISHPTLQIKDLRAFNQQIRVYADKAELLRKDLFSYANLITAILFFIFILPLRCFDALARPSADT